MWDVCVPNTYTVLVHLVHYSDERVLSFLFRLSRTNVGSINDDLLFYNDIYSLLWTLVHHFFMVILIGTAMEVFCRAVCGTSVYMISPPPLPLATWQVDKLYRGNLLNGKTSIHKIGIKAGGEVPSSSTINQWNWTKIDPSHEQAIYFRGKLCLAGGQTSIKKGKEGCHLWKKLWI